MIDSSAEIGYDVVVPTVGRDSLGELLWSLAEADGPAPRRIVIVDDRPGGDQPIEIPVPERLSPLLRWLRSGGRGPAAARNVGWRACSSEWVVFLDDDVRPGTDWCNRLVGDLRDVPVEVVGVQGRLEVPLPTDRRPTDWERNVAGLVDADWATADMAYRRWALELVGGFDERFPRAFREDADIALRILAAGLTLKKGHRTTAHPPGRARFAGSVGRQAGNQDDSLMHLLHGFGWRRRAGVARGRRALHLLTTATGIAAISSRLRMRRRLWMEAAWLASTIHFLWSRVRGGRRHWREILDMVITSLVVPPVAVAHWIYGWLRNVSLLRKADGGRRSPRDSLSAPVEAVLFDRDGTLIVDVPYNGDAKRVEPLPGATEALAALRSRGLKLGVVTNQSGVGRDLITPAEVEEVKDRIVELLGRFDSWQICLHSPDEGCECRKPAPGMILKAAADLGVRPEQCVVIGDIGTDVAAARAAGAGHILVPTIRTLPEEIAEASITAADLPAAVDKLEPYLREPS